MTAVRISDDKLTLPVYKNIFNPCIGKFKKKLTRKTKYVTKMNRKFFLFKTDLLRIGCVLQILSKRDVTILQL